MKRAPFNTIGLAVLGVALIGIPVGILYIYWASQMGPRPPEHLGFVAPLIALVGLPLLWFKVPAAHRRTVMIGTVVFGAASWTAITYGAAQWSRFGDQVRNLESMTEVARSIEELMGETGEYPVSLNLVSAGLSRNDWWGRRLHFQSSGSTFVLVSYGRDGIPNGQDYWAMRRQFLESERIVNTCGDWAADQVLTDLGFVQVCGK